MKLKQEIIEQAYLLNNFRKEAAYMEVEFNNREPIYIQIISHIKKQLICGTLKCDDIIPSRRELALLLNVNANTVQRAYKEMEAMNIIRTDRNSPSTIIVDENQLLKMKKEYIRDNFLIFKENMKAIEVSKDEVIDIVKEQYDLP